MTSQICENTQRKLAYKTTHLQSQFETFIIEYTKIFGTTSLSLLSVGVWVLCESMTITRSFVMNVLTTGVPAVAILRTVVQR